NELATREDAERVQRSGLIDTQRVRAEETGACPHTAIREDPTLNQQMADELEARVGNLDMVQIESGGDNLASTFSVDLVE
ncbi:GTP-binding protein, partial [Pseudomonas syringae group genomosp. 7]|uniref:GTP-binding protein n=1 Tax=Pseudomonas syringae group genomosp. 7 TaxID=251699 RepID=UPI0037707411